jgi:hypothetical protein
MTLQGDVLCYSVGLNGMSMITASVDGVGGRKKIHM